jgi:hypothetical protein
MDYRKQMYGEWVAPTPYEQMLERAAQEYHERCDAYDAKICTAISPRTGEPFPANIDQYAAINTNAYNVRREILARYGVTEAELHKAIVNYRRRT